MNKKRAVPGIVATLVLVLTLGGCSLEVVPLSAESGDAEAAPVTETQAPAEPATASDAQADAASTAAEPTFEVKDGVLVSVDTAGAKTVVVPDEVTQIGDGAFAFASDLEYVLIPEGVTSIGEGAFMECTRLRHVNLPSTLASIGKDAFFYCDGLSNIALPEGLERIDAGAFYHADALQKLSFGPALTEIGAYAFSHSGLVELDLSNCPKLTTIATDLCADCKQLSVVRLAQSVTELGDGAFKRSAVCELELPDALESIGADCFQGCEELTKLSTGARQIGNGAFAGAILNEVTLLGSVESIGERAFIGCPVLSFAVAAENEHYASKDGVLYTKDASTLVCYPMGAVARSFVVPDTVTAIADCAFANVQLTAVTLPAKLEKIGPRAFARSELTALDVPDSVTSIGEAAFQDCINLQRITLGAGVQELPANACAYCAALTELKFTDALSSIHPSAFLGCSGFGDSYEGTGLDASPNFSVVDGMLMSEDGKTLLAHPNMTARSRWAAYLADLAVNGMKDEQEEQDEQQAALTVTDEGTTDDEEVSTDAEEAPGEDATDQDALEYTVPSTVTAIGDDAFSYAPVTILHLTGALDSMGEHAFGYNASGSALRVRAIIDEASSEAVRDYAAQNDIAYFTGPIDATTRELSLEAGQTQAFTVEHVDAASVVYSSDDPEVARVDEQGTITAVAQGEVSIVATVCGYDFCCHVTVTGGEAAQDAETLGYEALLTEADDALSLEEAEDRATPWLKDYLRNNPDEVFEQAAYPAVNQYSSDDYAQIKSEILGPTSDYYRNTVQNSGPIGDQFQTVADNLTKELTDGPRVHKNTVTYSGTNDVTMFTGASNSLADMKGAIGTTITTNNVISTSLTPTVAHAHTGDSPAATMLEFYVPEGFDDGIYLDTFSVYQGEMELLLNKGIRLKVLDAGVREVKEADGKSSHTERYLKLLAFAE